MFDLIKCVIPWCTILHAAADLTNQDMNTARYFSFIFTHNVVGRGNWGGGRTWFEGSWRCVSH